MDGSNTELGSPPQDTSKKTFSIVSAKENDSLGSTEWKGHLDRNSLNEAWAAPEGSRWGRFEKTKLIDSVNKWANDLRPRYSEGESNSEQGVENLIRSSVLGKDTAVVLDSGGAHSVAMAITLARELGYQPIVIFNTEPHPEGANKAEQDLATLLYFAEEVKNLKSGGKIKPDAPPAFILDTHRDDYMIEKKKEGDNRYTYSSQDFPSAKEFTGGGVFLKLFTSMKAISMGMLPHLSNQ